MKIFVSGTDARDKDKICRELGANNLYSFMDSKKSIRDWTCDDQLLLVDSGAHSYNKLDITPVGYTARKKLPEFNQYRNDYFKYMELYKYRKFIWVELDLYGSLSMQEVDDMEKRYQDIGAAGKYLRVYHPVCDGGSLDTMRKWIEDGHDLIGIGNDSKHLLDDIFDLTRDKVKVQGFAMTKLDLLHKYPFWSADSTTPLSTIIFGKISKPVMSYVNKDDMIDMKHIHCLQTDQERLYDSIKEAQKTEAYFTELWKRRGVVWDELKFE